MILSNFLFFFDKISMLVVCLLHFNFFSFMSLLHRLRCSISRELYPILFWGDSFIRIRISRAVCSNLFSMTLICDITVWSISCLLLIWIWSDCSWCFICKCGWQTSLIKQVIKPFAYVLTLYLAIAITICMLTFTFTCIHHELLVIIYQESLCFGEESVDYNIDLHLCLQKLDDIQFSLDSA